MYNRGCDHFTLQMFWSILWFVIYKILSLIRFFPLIDQRRICSVKWIVPTIVVFSRKISFATVVEFFDMIDFVFSSNIINQYINCASNTAHKHPSDAFLLGLRYLFFLIVYRLETLSFLTFFDTISVVSLLIDWRKRKRNVKRLIISGSNSCMRT